MLTMTAPYKYRFFAPYIKYFTSSDWVKFSLDLIGGSSFLEKWEKDRKISIDSYVT